MTVRAFGVGCFLFLFIQVFLGPSSAKETYSSTLLLCIEWPVWSWRANKSCARHGFRALRDEESSFVCFAVLCYTYS